MTAIIIRQAEERDLVALSGLISALAGHHRDRAETGEAVLRRDILGNDPWLKVWVAEARGGLVGYVACQKRVQMQFGKRGIDLHHLYVEAARRGEGVGTALVEVARNWARSESCSVVMVGTEPDNLRAQAFYLGLGFQQVSVDGMRFCLPLEVC